MDYGRLPVTALLRGPLLHTPQGRVVLFYLAAYLLAAAVAGLFGTSPWPQKPPSVFITLCVTWPFIVFLIFVRDSHPGFSPSWGKAAWLVFYGALPLLFTAYHAWRS